MGSNSRALQSFLETWLAEFGRTVGMFTGAQPELDFAMTESLSMPKTAPALWLKQVFSTESSFEVWIGAQEPTWAELGKALGEGTPDSLRSTYLDIINQAQQGVATAVSADLPSPLVCGDAESFTSATFNPSAFFICDLRVVNEAYPPIVIAVERTALRVLEAAVAGPKQPRALVNSQKQEFNSAKFRRVADLSLPVSVLIGSAKLDLSRALKARSGTVIALAKDSSDLVELLVDGVLVARGELVVVKGNYGFRIKQMVSRNQRISLCGI